MPGRGRGSVVRLDPVVGRKYRNTTTLHSSSQVARVMVKVRVYAPLRCYAWPHDGGATEVLHHVDEA
eukprot:2840388-Pyramimonas_sp.AAC.1